MRSEATHKGAQFINNLLKLNYLMVFYKKTGLS